MDATPNSQNIAQWYADHHPHLPVHSIIPDACADCARLYSIGESVVLRSEPDGDVYTVIAVIASPDNPALVTVQHPDGLEPTFAKSQIRLYTPPEPEFLPDVKQDGFF